MLLYLDGELKQTDAHTIAMGSDEEPTRIGSRTINGTEPFVGKMGYVRLYGEQLSAPTISATNATQKVQLGIASRASSDLNLDATKVFDMTSSGDGSAPQDGSTNNATVTATQLADYDLGVTNGASTYNGSTSVASVPDSNELDLGASMCISAWINPTTTADNERILDKGYWLGTSNSAYKVKYGTLEVNAGSISTGVWTCVSANYNGTTLSLFTNGFVAGTSTNGTAPSSATNLLYIASSGSGDYFDGKIDEVKIYNSAINPASLYTNESTLFGNFPYYASIPQYDSLVWGASFNAANDGKTQDWSAMGRNGNHGTDTQVAKSIATGAATLNGTTSYILLSDDDIFSIGNGSTDTAYSFSFWMKSSDATSNEGVISKYDATAGDTEWLIQQASDTLVFLISDKSTGGYIAVQTGAILSDDTWTHVGITYSGNGSASGMKIYTDGAEASVSDISSGSYTASENTAQPVWVGVFRTGGGDFNYYTGSLDDPLIWNTALSSNEVYNLYRLRHPPQ
jgi:hypothetical protein